MRRTIQMPPLAVNSQNATALPSGDHEASASCIGELVTVCTGPPSSGITYRSREFPFRQE